MGERPGGSERSARRGGGGELSREVYDKAIGGCGDAKAWDMVLLLVAEMRSDGVPTSPAAFETALKVRRFALDFSSARNGGALHFPPTCAGMNLYRYVQRKELPLLLHE